MILKNKGATRSSCIQGLAEDCRLHDEIVALVQYVMPTPAEITARQKILTRVAELIQRRFRDCHVDVFGSVAQELSLPGG